jgi:hypothetical protein
MCQVFDGRRGDLLEWVEDDHVADPGGQTP